jgi:biotin operon repressor
MEMPTHDRLLAVLSKDHIGLGKAISGEALAAQIGCKVRTIRALVLKLRENAVAVCGRPETGYYIAETAEEVDATCKLLEAHGLHQLAVAARMRKTTLPELLGQLHLNT